MNDYTISVKAWSKSYLRRFFKKFDYCSIELPNGAKCNPNFFWECVRLGILSEDD